MKLTYKIPETKKDITVTQFMQLKKLYEQAEENETEVSENQIVSICINLPVHLVDKLPKTEYDYALQVINKALSTDSSFVQRFHYKDIEFGFIPDLEKITAGEYAALEIFMNDQNKHYLDIINVLYRPITDEKEYTNWWSKDKVKKYTIESYDRDDFENKDDVDTSYFKDVPYEIYEGACFFFLNLKLDLLIATQKYMKAEEVKMTEVERLERNGDGFKRSILTLKQQELKLRKLVKKVQVKYYLD